MGVFVGPGVKAVAMSSVKVYEGTIIVVAVGIDVFAEQATMLLI